MKIDFLKSDFNFNYILFSAITGCFLYGYIAYFTVRSEFFQLISLSVFAFIITYILIEKSQLKFNQLLILALVYRLIFLLASPNLSQDFFRFFWDGQLVLQGINPYVENVNYYFDNNLTHLIYNASELRQGMGELNARHYSNYPPMSQFIYAISAWFAKDSIYGFIIALRLILISFDLLFIFFAKKILEAFQKEPRILFWYVLNPLCILEITGNLHLEGVMISLFIMGFYFMMKHKFTFSALCLSLSITTKLMSLIFIPILIKYFLVKLKTPKSYKSILVYGFWLFSFLLIQFAFFYNPTFINNFAETLSLWFGKFEFNASIFYIVRWIGYEIVGWNIIQTYGVYMPVAFVIIFLASMFITKATLTKILELLMWMFVIYYLLSTTVHPWYILFPLALSVFTNYKFVILWSVLILTSYYAYTITEVKESELFLILEYGVVLLYMAYEILKQKKPDYLENLSLNKNPR